MRFLITGAEGFIGAVLAHRLCALEEEVSLVIRPGSDTWRLKDLPSRVRRVPADVRDASSLKRAFAEARPEFVYHLASHGGYPFQTDAPVILETNILGTWNALEACAGTPCRLFVHTGSSSEYGFKKDLMRETDRIEPNSFYAVGKAAATHLCSFMAARSAFPIVTLRLSSVYGPYEEPSRLIPTLLRRCLRNEPLEMVSRETARDFVFVEDVLDVFLKTDRLVEFSGEVVNIATSVQSTMEDVVRLALKVTGSSSEVRWNAMAPRKWDTSNWVLSTDRARERLGWSAAHTLEQGLARTLEWMRAREGAAR